MSEAPTPHLAFRRATDGDATLVRALTRHAYARWVAVLGREPLPMTADYEAAVRDHRIDLMMVDGEMAGLVETVREDGHLLIENVALAPPFQGQGLGRHLMAHAEAMAVAQGVDTLRLYANALMTANIRLYAGLGYHVDRREDHPDGRTVVHMTKRLGS